MRIIFRLFAALVLAGLTLSAGEPGGLAHPAVSLHRIHCQNARELQTLLGRSSGALPLVSAHRGGPREGFPENCLATFEETLRHTFAILEVDPRRTKDGGIVLHHDATLERTTTGSGKVTDFTLAELGKLYLKDSAGKITGFRIPTLDDALEWARGKTILVLDQKDVSVADRVRKIEQHRAEGYAMLIVNTFKDAQACYGLNTNIAMEVMIPNLPKAEEFNRLGIPWRNVVAFVGHNPPDDPALYEFIHRQGARCMIGTSRNLDRRMLTGSVSDIKSLEADYRAFLRRGADLIETDIPIPLGDLLYRSSPVPPALEKILLAPEADRPPETTNP